MTIFGLSGRGPQLNFGPLELTDVQQLVDDGTDGWYNREGRGRHSEVMFDA
jgi:hypothetical protein